jgi:hypothetical protein
MPWPSPSAKKIFARQSCFCGLFRLATGHLEKLLSMPIADSPGVNVNESDRERNGIIRWQFCGAWQGAAIFRGALHLSSMVSGGQLELDPLIQSAGNPQKKRKPNLVH